MPCRPQKFEEHPLRAQMHRCFGGATPARLPGPPVVPPPLQVGSTCKTGGTPGLPSEVPSLQRRAQWPSPAASARPHLLMVFITLEFKDLYMFHVEIIKLRLCKQLQCPSKVFTPLSMLHLLLHCSHLLESFVFIFFSPQSTWAELDYGTPHLFKYIFDTSLHPTTFV